MRRTANIGPVKYGWPLKTGASDAHDQFCSYAVLVRLNQLSNMSGLPQSMRTGPWSGLDQAINELTAVCPLYVVAAR